MPLTGAEKTRRYTENLKKNRPEEYKAQCKRNLQRMNSKKKKISEMSPSEAENQRQKWREEKRRSNKQKKEKKNEQTETSDETPVNTCREPSVTSNDKTVKKLRVKYKLLSRKFTNLSIQVQKLKAQKEAYKKRYHRLKQSTNKQIAILENDRQKQKAREEVLEYTLKTTYQQTKTHKEKKILKRIIQNTTNKTYVRKLMGLKGKGRKTKNKFKRVEIPEITKFYLRDDVSRNTAGKKETKTRNKNKLQIRYLTDSLVNLYKKYKSENGRYGLTTFYKQKPFYVISPHLKSRDTCLCIKHSNLEFQHISLKKLGLFKTGVREILNEISCDTRNYACMYRKCKDCKDRKPLYCPKNYDDDNINVSWSRWERHDHTYPKTEGNETIEIKTKKTAKVLKTGTLETLKNDFEKDLQAFKTHHFNMQHQQKQYQKAISQLKDNEVIIICDFSENYEAKLGREIQAMHFGASKNQITLHTGMIYWANRSQSFCTIAEVNNHQPPAIWAHLTPLLDLIKNESENITVVHFFSDGPSSQYRQKNNFYLLAYFTKYHGFDYATWSFFESGHGKSVADGIGGCVKRTLDAKVCHGMDVVNAKNAFEILSQCLKRIKVFMIPDSAINDISKILPLNVQVLKGTLQVHQIITRDENSLKFRDISCFCGPRPGHCDCFSPQIHYVTPCNVNTQLHSKKKHISSNPATTISSHSDSASSMIKDNLKPSGQDFLELTSKTSTKVSLTNLPKNVKKVNSGQDFQIVNTDLEPPSKKLRKYCRTNLPYIEPELSTENLKRSQSIDTSCSDISNFISYTNDSASSTSKINLKPANSDQSLWMSNIDLLPPFSQPIESLTILNIDPVDIDTLPMTISDSDNLTKNVKTEAMIHDNTESSLRARKPFQKTKSYLKCLECHKCKTNCYSSKKVKCMVCLRWYCEICVDGSPMEIDYICDECLED